MRILIGHPTEIPELIHRTPLPGRESADDEILCFGAGYRRIDWRPSMSWSEILSACPPGWRPDVYIHWKIEYAPVPLGLERADCLTVGVLGDWNLGGHALRAVGDLFDVLVADKNGAEAIRTAGYPQVLNAQLWGYDPKLHRKLASASGEAERDLDIVMIGSFNHAIHAERFRTLARAAALSRRYKVFFSMGLYGEEYTKALNRARIVFNYAVRGEINMRAYEAPACGALLFQEAHNAEITTLYRPGEEVVLYQEDDLEALLAYYLTHEAERARIAAAGERAVQPHTYARHLGDLLNALEGSGFGRGRRGFVRETPRRQRVRLATQWLKACEPHILPHTDALLAREVERTPEPERAELLLMRAATAGEWARCLADPTAKRRTFDGAIGLAEQALRLDPNLLSARFSLAFLRLEQGDFEGGGRLIAELAALLEREQPDPSVLKGPFYPRAFTGYDVALEGVWMHHAPGSATWAAEVRTILRCHLHSVSSELHYARQEYALAADHARCAVMQRPETFEARLLLARALRALGRSEEAVRAYGEALGRLAFLPLAWEEQARLLMDLGRAEEAAAGLREWLAIVEGMPIYASMRPDFEALLREAAAGMQTSSRQEVRRLLALPDWRDPGEWRALVRTFAETYTPREPVLLMLRADPNEAPPAALLLQELGGFLMHDLAADPAALPNITLLNEPLAPEDRWKPVHVAHALIAVHDLPPVWRELAHAADKPIWTLDDLRKRESDR